MEKRLEATVSGRVQGVWFRKFTTDMARTLGIVGEARNLPDGKVYVIAEGMHERLLKLLEHLHQGPKDAAVEKVDVAWGVPQGAHTTFEIT